MALAMLPLVLALLDQAPLFLQLAMRQQLMLRQAPILGPATGGMDKTPQSAFHTDRLRRLGTTQSTFETCLKGRKIGLMDRSDGP